MSNIDFPFVIKTTIRWLLRLSLWFSIAVILFWLLGILEKFIADKELSESNSIFISTLLNLAKQNYFTKLGLTLTDICAFGGALFLISFILLMSLPKQVKQKQFPLQYPLKFPQITKIDDPKVRENIERATKNLSIEMVDMGLFYFGKIFEEQLKEYLLEVQEKGSFPVTEKDLKKAYNMIDCLERNDIELVSSSRYFNPFHYLRDERNKRAHGKTPSLEEREKLFRQAGFLGELYLDSIIAIQEHRKSL